MIKTIISIVFLKFMCQVFNFLNKQMCTYMSSLIKIIYMYTYVLSKNNIVTYHMSKYLKR